MFSNSNFFWRKKFRFTHVIFDVDGVFTNGSFVYDQYGKQYKIFGPHDSDGLNLLRQRGIELQAITADRRGFPITRKRMEDMGLDVSLVSEADRINYVRKYSPPDTTCFVGDGHYDAFVFDVVKYSIAPANAVSVARSKAKYVTSTSGGNGAVYEAAQHILTIMRD